MPLLADHLRSLRALGAVARHGSTMQAAQGIHLSQPAVARAVIEIERVCGMPLFMRGARGMAPTALGSQLAQRVETLVGHFEHGATEALAATPAADRGIANPARFPSAIRPIQMRALLAIATHGSEASAAAAIGVSQPAVHAAFHALEQTVGVRLGCRLPSGTRLTAAGDALLRRVKLALAELRAMEGDIASWQGAIRGSIVVGVLPLSVPMFLPRAIEMLLAAQPGIEVRIVDGTYDSLMRSLLAADIDILAGALRQAPEHPEVQQHHLFDDELVVVAMQGHPCLDLDNPSLRDLRAYEWVSPMPGTPAAQAMAGAFQSEGVALPARTLYSSSQPLTMALIKQTGRLALASRGEICLDDHRAQLRIVPLALPMTRRRIGVATRAVGVPSQELRILLEACQAAAAPGRADRPVRERHLRLATA